MRFFYIICFNFIHCREESSQTKKESLESVKEKLSRLQQEDTKLREEERGTSIIVHLVQLK